MSAGCWLLLWLTFHAAVRFPGVSLLLCCAMPCSRRLVPRLARLLPPDAELYYVEFDGGRAVTTRVASQVHQDGMRSVARLAEGRL